MSANERQRQRQEAENAVNEIYKVLEGMGSGDVVKTLKALRAKDTAKWIESMANIQAQLASQQQKPQPKPKKIKKATAKPKTATQNQTPKSSIDDRLETAEGNNSKTITLKQAFREEYKQIENKVAEAGAKQFYSQRLVDRTQTLSQVQTIEIIKKLSLEEAKDILQDYPQTILALEKWEEKDLGGFYQQRTGSPLSQDLEAFRKKLRDAKVLVDLEQRGFFKRILSTSAIGIKSIFLTTNMKKTMLERNRVIQSVTKLEGR